MRSFLSLGVMLILVTAFTGPGHGSGSSDFRADQEVGTINWPVEEPGRNAGIPYGSLGKIF